jgi:hypothetical protein
MGIFKMRKPKTPNRRGKMKILDLQLKVVGLLACNFFAFFILLSSVVVASPALPPRSIISRFAPTEMPKGPGAVKFELAFIKKTWKDNFEKEDYDCTEVEVRIKKLENLEYYGDTAWTVKVDSGVWYRTILDVVIPPNDTSGITIAMKCNRIWNDHTWYFVTTGDTVEFYRGNPRGYHPLEAPATNDDLILDTLTVEQLQKKYEVGLELEDSLNREFVEKLVGQLADSNTVDEKKGYYRLWMSLENIIKIRKRHIECGYVDPPPWTPEGRAKMKPNIKGVEPSESENDNEKSQLHEFKIERISRQTTTDDNSGTLQKIPLTESEKKAQLDLQRRQMHALEETPHKGDYNQHLLIGDEVWVREPGEYKFHISEPISDIKAC